MSRERLDSKPLAGCMLGSQIYDESLVRFMQAHSDLFLPYFAIIKSSILPVYLLTYLVFMFVIIVFCPVSKTLYQQIFSVKMYTAMIRCFSKTQTLKGKRNDDNHSNI